MSNKEISVVPGMIGNRDAHFLTSNLYSSLWFCLGGLIHIFSYGVITPFVAASIFFITTYILLILTPLGGVAERRMFSRVFAVGFLMAGIAAVYANQFQDKLQLFKDAANFFEMASGGAEGLTLIQLQLLSEGSLAIALWRAVYEFFSAIGFDKARYIGIFVNVTAVALTGVVGIKIIRSIFGNDEARFRRLTLLVSCCGLFWLFAGIHLRDSVILLAVTSLAYIWLRFLTKPEFGWRLFQVFFWSLLAGILFGFLRKEFVFVPIAMAFATVAALFLGRKTSQQHLIVYGLVVVGVVSVVVLAVNFGERIFLALVDGYSNYTGTAAKDHEATNSLGMSLIVNQPIPIRLMLGSVYLFVFPIPFWSGFSLESAYALFKSANAVFFYFVMPLLYMSLRQLIKHKSLRTPALLFIVFLSLGFTLAIAGSSIETRHFGVFLMPIFVLATIPDLRIPTTWNNYKYYLQIVFVGVLFVHISWLVLKF